jgi:hypothetical protein
MSSGGSKRNDGGAPTSAHILLPCKASKMMINSSFLPPFRSSTQLFVRRLSSITQKKTLRDKKREKKDLLLGRVSRSTVLKLHWHCQRPKPWKESTMAIGKAIEQVIPALATPIYIQCLFDVSSESVN